MENQSIFGQLDSTNFFVNATLHNVLILNYTSTSYHHNEDNWDMSFRIHNLDDLSEAFMEIYKRDARNRVDYPLNGMVRLDWCSFTQQRMVKVDNERFYGRNTPTDNPDFFFDAYYKFEKKVKRIKQTLGVFKEIRGKRETENKDIELYNKLKTKFEQ